MPDPRVWRAAGAPLVSATGSGPLGGLDVAVKDLFAIEGQRIGAGVPAYFAGARVEAATAPAVAQLLAAGASVRGIAQTDEFAYSIAGRNFGYGTPPNPAVPGAVPGGSSSGSATAVSLGQAAIGLGTDTAGSIRVPASYQGLWGLRTTHGAVPVEGLLPLAPSFDAIGWLTRDLSTLRRVALVGVPGEGVPGETVPIGAWVAAHPGVLAPDVQARFDAASQVDAAMEAKARAHVAEFREALDTALGGRVLLLPSASSVAPALDALAEVVEAARMATLRLTCLAGIGGYPALSMPGLRVAGGPVGLCLVGPRGSDVALLDVAADWEE